MLSLPVYIFGHFFTGHEKIQTTLGTYGHLYPNTNLEVAKKLTGILQVQSATESIANYTSNQHTAINIQQSITEQLKKNNAMKMQSYKEKAVKPL